MKTKTMLFVTSIVVVLVLLMSGCTFPQSENVSPNKANEEITRADEIVEANWVDPEYLQSTGKTVTQVIQEGVAELAQDVPPPPTPGMASAIAPSPFQILNVADIIAHPSDYFKVNFTSDPAAALDVELGLSIDRLKYTVSRIPEIYVKDTSYNKYSVFNFSITNIMDNVIYAKCTVRARHYEKFFGMRKIWDVRGNVSFKIPLHVYQKNGKNVLGVEKIYIQNVDIDSWFLDLIPPIKSYIESEIINRVSPIDVYQSVELPYLGTNMVVLNKIFTENGFMFFNFQIMNNSYIDIIKGLLAQYGISDHLNLRPLIRVLNGSSTLSNNGTISLGTINYCSSRQIQLTIKNVGWARMNFIGSPKVAISTGSSYYQVTASALPDFIDPGNTQTLLLTITPNRSNYNYSGSATFKITTDSLEESTFSNKITFYTGS